MQLVSTLLGGAATEMRRRLLLPPRQGVDHGPHNTISLIGTGRRERYMRVTQLLEVAPSWLMRRPK